MKPLFNSVKVKKPKSNVFDMSYDRKMSFKMGQLIPVMVQEVIPGDKFKVDSEMMVRFAPMIAPVMHRVNVHNYFFWVPNRLVWDNFQSYITGGVNGTDNPTFPTLSMSDANKALFGVGSLADHLGLPSYTAGTVVDPQDVSALPFRAYSLIWNEYFRDQTQQAAIALTKNDTVAAGELSEITQLRYKCWEKDYFTSALPFAQRGGTVVLPSTPSYSTNPQATFASAPAAGSNVTVVNNAASSVLQGGGQLMTKFENLSGVDIKVTDLRRATRLQQWLERNALGGSRYVEQILAHFGVRSSDARLQRPVFLGGSKNPVVMSEVLSTVYDHTQANPQGTMAGHGISVGQNGGFSKFFEEHGYIIGLTCILPKTSYQDGIPRHFQKADRYDYFFPEFAHIGEQAIKAKEVFYKMDGSTANNNATWGYTPRYAEYRFNNSSVHGQFRTTLSYWHAGRIFSGSIPQLNENFVKSDPTNRIFAVQDGSDNCWAQMYFRVRAIRPIPVYGEPLL